MKFITYGIVQGNLITLRPWTYAIYISHYLI